MMHEGSIRVSRRNLLPLLTLTILLAGPALVEVDSSQKEGTYAPSRLDNSADAESAWWQELNVVSTGSTITELDRLVNVIGLGQYLELEMDQQYYRRLVGRMHYKGGRYAGLISAGHAHYRTYVERPELAASVMIDIYGEPVIHGESTPEHPIWCQSLNEPQWQAFLLEQGRALVDAGVDAINIDEIEGNTNYIFYGGSFGEHDMSGFRAYLQGVYTPQELLDLFGIDDIETFDYGVYIHDHGLADTWMNFPQGVPLFDDFWRFQRLAGVEFMTELINETFGYAQTTYGRSVVFTGNPWALSSGSLVVADLLDYFTNEYPYSRYGYPPESQAIPDHKLARALGDKPAVMFPDVLTLSDLADYDSLSTLMTIYIAEGYASQGALMVPYGSYGPLGGPDWSYADMVPVYDFVLDNPFLYEGLDSLAQVAVLYSFPSALSTWSGDRAAFRGLAYALLDGHVQYDIVALGDDVWLADSFSMAKLAPYQLVFLPAAAYLSDAQVDSVLSFVAGGGTLVAWGDTGTHDETGQQVERPELAALTVPGTHVYGDGWFITLTEDPGESYVQTHDAAARQQLVSLVNDHTDRVTTSSAARTLNLLAYEQVDGSQVVVHLINYDYDIETDQITPTMPFTMTIRPPVGFLDQGDIQVYRMSPPYATPRLLDFGVDGGTLVIDHPGVEIFDVLIALPETDASVLASEMLDDLNNEIAQANVEGYDTTSLDGILAQIDNAQAVDNHLLARQLGLEALDLLHLLTRKRVLFDEAHNETNTLSWERALTIEPERPGAIYFGKLAATLEDDFVFERNPDASLSLVVLQNYDALMLAAPQTTMDAIELEAINQFVAEGGGLLVLGTCGLDHPVNMLTSAYNITFDPHCIFAPGSEDEGNFVIDTFADHQATARVPFMVTNWGGSLTAEGSAVALAMTGEDAWQDTNWSYEYEMGEPTGPFTMAAAYEAGRGRVAAVSDNAFQDDGFVWFSNDLFMRSLLRWVTDWHPAYDNRACLPIVLRGWNR